MDNRVFRASNWIITLGILNFYLFIAVSLVIGGHALNGGVDNGQYYLGGGGRHTPVPYMVFLYSQVHSYCVLASWPAIIVLSLVSWATWPQDSGIVFGIDPKERTPRGLTSFIAFVIRTIVWRSVDFLEEGAWLLLDSWRRPDVEFFARDPHVNCLSKLRFRVNFSGQVSGPAVFARITGRHFQLVRTPQRSTLLLYRGPFPALNGKIVPTNHGTYVRAWHRFPSESVLLPGLLLGTFVGLLAIAMAAYPLSPQLPPDGPHVTWAIPLVALVFSAATVGSLLSLFIGARIGKRLDQDLRALVLEALTGPERTAVPNWRTGPA
jgi:hypothetical protein